MKVLVTGHHGYIGSVLAPYLADAGHDVTGLDTGFYRGCDFGPDTATVEGLTADVRDVTPAELEGFDAIVHLAALSNDPLGDLDPGLTKDINGDGTLQLARTAREAGVRRFVFASSCSMYGASGTDDALDENAPLRPLTPYAESKVRAEEGLVELAGPDFAPVSMRNATVFGVSPRLRLDIVLNNLAAWAHTTGRIRLLSDGTAWRPLVHVRDVAKAAAGACSRRRRIRSAARRSTSEPTSRTTVVRELAEVLASGHRLRDRDRGGLVGRLAVVPRRLLEARRAPSRTSRSSGTPNAARESSSRPTARSVSRRRTSTATATSGCAGCSRCSTRESSTTTFAGARRSLRDTARAGESLDLQSTRKPMKVSFFGHFGSSNSGNESTLLAILSRLRALSPESEFRCICTQPGVVVARDGIEAIPITTRAREDLGSRRSLGQTGADGFRRGGRRASAVRPCVQEAQGNRHADRSGDGAADRRLRPFQLGSVQPVQVGR